MEGVFIMAFFVTGLIVALVGIGLMWKSSGFPGFLGAIIMIVGGFIELKGHRRGGDK